MLNGVMLLWFLLAAVSLVLEPAAAKARAVSWK